ncbi:DUF4177 domain-containing protein [Oscillibacter sp.]|uniref:DUF4177 domain-containing protein n=1 Tax=Oscillibacter sp. TaxID=1945593 RepID=UPI002D80E3EF|nr:DUF4177 domain-containing protein [Oscillibacter sp.]
MLEYEFEKAFGGGFFVTEIEGYQDIIRRRAAEGWRYAGFIPTQQSGHGIMVEIDLIFEREQGGKA